MALFNIENHLPLIAILRGVEPNDIVRIANILVEEGFTMLEVPLNSPDALSSIRLMVDHFGPDLLLGAGTVTTEQEANAVIATGANLVVTPNLNEAVIKAAVAANCVCFPGVVTPTEAFAALAAGATGLKLFPVSQVGINGYKALKSVLPKDVLTMPVGGINPTVESMKPYIDIGANGFGLGASLYQVGMSDDQIRSNAKQFVGAYKQCFAA